MKELIPFRILGGTILPLLWVIPWRIIFIELSVHIACAHYMLARSVGILSNNVKNQTIFFYRLHYSKTFHTLTHLILIQLYEVGTIISSILHLRRLRQRKLM